MHTNWSVILNALLLFGVILGIMRVVLSKRNRNESVSDVSTLHDMIEETDDIIAVRRISPEDEDDEVIVSEAEVIDDIGQEEVHNPDTLMLLLMAKDDKQLAGYELLQSLLAVGFRFGSGGLFHRHQNINGKGPVLFSLAAASKTGTFDLQNIGGISVRGLCLYMEKAGSPKIDADRFKLMLETARQLQGDLDTLLLDDTQKPFTDDTQTRYDRYLGVHVSEADHEVTT